MYSSLYFWWRWWWSGKVFLSCYIGLRSQCCLCFTEAGEREKVFYSVLFCCVVKRWRMMFFNGVIILGSDVASALGVKYVFTLIVANVKHLVVKISWVWSIINFHGDLVLIFISPLWGGLPNSLTVNYWSIVVSHSVVQDEDGWNII